MTESDTKADDESEPDSKRVRYLRTANLVVRFIANIVKLVVILSG